MKSIRKYLAFENLLKQLERCRRLTLSLLDVSQLRLDNASFPINRLLVETVVLQRRFTQFLST